MAKKFISYPREEPKSVTTGKIADQDLHRINKESMVHALKSRMSR